MHLARIVRSDCLHKPLRGVQGSRVQGFGGLGIRRLGFGLGSGP